MADVPSITNLQAIPNDTWKAIHLSLEGLSAKNTSSWAKAEREKVLKERALICEFLSYLSQKVYNKSSAGLMRMTLRQHGELSESLSNQFPELKRFSNNTVLVSVKDKSPAELGALLLPTHFYQQAGAHLTRWASQSPARAHAVLHHSYLKSLLPEIELKGDKLKRLLSVLGAVVLSVFVGLCVAGAALFTGGLHGVIVFAVVSVALSGAAAHLWGANRTPVRDLAKQYQPGVTEVKPNVEPSVVEGCDEKSIRKRLLSSPDVSDTPSSSAELTADSSAESTPLMNRSQSTSERDLPALETKPEGVVPTLSMRPGMGLGVD